MLATAGTVVLWFVVVMAAMLMRAHENKMDAMANIIIRGSEEPEECNLEDIDDVVGVAMEPRLFHVHAHGDHRDGEECEDWMLSVAAGDVPSSVLAPYPSLRGNKGDKVIFDARGITEDDNWAIALSDDILGIFEAHDFPFTQLRLAFSGPSETESFAMKVEVVATHLANEYSALTDEEREGDVPAILNERLSKVLDIGVSVDNIVVADQEG